MALSKDIEKVLSEFGLNLVIDTKSSLRKKLDERAAKHNGRKRTSRLEASMGNQPPIKFTSDSIRFTFVMNDYWEVVENGRKPSSVSKEGQDKIKEWSAVSGFAENIRLSDLEQRKDRQSKSKSKRKLKSLKKMPFDRAKKQAAFLVARSLKNKRLEPTHFFSEVINDGRIKELEDKLSELIKTDIIINIL